MKFNRNANHRVVASAFFLIECLVYLALFAVVSGLAITAYLRFDQQSRRLRQNASDITRALEAGESWREDVRHAEGKITTEKKDVGLVIHIPHRNGEVVYAFQNSEVKRLAGGKTVLLLSNVKSLAIEPDLRKRVNAWRWEVELKQRDPKSKLLPLFTFTAVSPGGAK